MLAVVLFNYFLFHKATLGFDAVIIVWGLAAATGFGLRALLDMCLRHTPPGGEVEGHTPRPRENPIPLHAVHPQLDTEKYGASEQTFPSFLPHHLQM